MNTIYFISPQDIKNNTPTNLNLEDKRIIMGINDAQSIQIQQALGTNLYAKLKSLLPTDINIAGNAKYKTLLDEYVIPALIKWALVEVLPYTVFKIENKSTLTQNSDNSSPVDLESLQYFIQLNKDKAEFYNQRLIDYLCANNQLFPEYTTTTSNDQILPSSTGYFCGLQIDSGHDCDKFVGYNNRTIDLT